MNQQQKNALKKKSSSLGVELKPLVHCHEDTSYGSAPSDRWFHRSQEAGHANSEDEHLTRQNATEVPRAVQLMRPENLAISACYLCVGLMQGLSRPLLNVYPLDLGATEAQQTTIFSVAMLPCTFKIFFGFLSDQLPFWGMRRKGYMWIGWSISTVTMAILLMTCSLSMDWNNSDGAIAPEGAPSVQQLSLSFLIFGIGMWMADCMGDSIVAERAKLEPSSSRGQLQSSCYACRFFGMMVAAPISTLLYSSDYGPWSIVMSMAIIPPIILGPLMYLLEEMPPTRVLSTKDQCQEIWAAVCSRAVWQPMGFVSAIALLYFAPHTQPSHFHEYLTGLSLQHSSSTKRCLASISKDSLGLYWQSIEFFAYFSLCTPVRRNACIQVLLYSIQLETYLQGGHSVAWRI